MIVGEVLYYLLDGMIDVEVYFWLDVGMIDVEVCYLLELEVNMIVDQEVQQVCLKFLGVIDGFLFNNNLFF